ncbi:hypothetical protein CEB3_c12490 [Peptococcaceae bacterium CEB3]|nr:hypothetical protein CEB3_c12490 [Peptococcaceae bacterium CEB3]
MDITENRNQRIHETRKKLIPNLIVNLILPWLLYVVVRPHFANDTFPLAISATIPTIKTIVHWVWHRKLDWTGLLSLTILAISLLVTYLSGDSALPLKIIQPAMLGLLGLIFLGSVLLGRPLMLLIVSKTVGYQNSEHPNNPLAHKKLTIMTALIGGVILIGAITNITMALILPTSTFLVIKYMVSVGIVVALLFSIKVVIPKIK